MSEAFRRPQTSDTRTSHLAYTAYILKIKEAKKIDKKCCYDLDEFLTNKAIVE